jgi:hypothetical protein
MSRTIAVLVFAMTAAGLAPGEAAAGSAPGARCVRALLARQTRHERCLRACDRRAAARPSVDVDGCKAHCAAMDDAAVARVNRRRACRADADLAAHPKFIAGGVVWPNPVTSSNGMCLDVRNGNSANRTPIQMYRCNGTAAQDWFVQGTAIRGLAGKCLDMPYAVTGGGVWLFDCWGGPNQQWSLIRASVSINLPGGYYVGGLNAYGAGSGAPVQISTGFTPSSWEYTAGGEFRLPDGRCLQPGWAGAMAVTCNGSAYQKWQLGPRPSGIRWSVNPAYCLHATDFVRWWDGSTRSSITVERCDPYTPHQRWRVNASIRGMGNMCLTMPSGAVDWTPVTLRACHSLFKEYHQAWGMTF